MCLASIQRVQGAFLFALTKDKEIVSLINKKDPTVITGLEEKLQSNDEMIAFSSYIYLGKESCIALAGKTYSPRFALIGEYVNHYLSEIKLSERYEFILEPLVNETTKQELLKLAYIGKTKIRLNAKTTIFRDALNFLTAQDVDSNLQYIEISLTPKRKQNLKDDVNKIMKSISDDELESIIAKGKDEIGRQMQDIYVFIKGGIRDKLTLSKHAEENFPKIISIVSQNNLLSQKIKECIEQNEIQKDCPLEIKELLKVRYPCSI